MHARQGVCASSIRHIFASRPQDVSVQHPLHPLLRSMTQSHFYPAPESAATAVCSSGRANSRRANFMFLSASIVGCCECGADVRKHADLNCSSIAALKSSWLVRSPPLGAAVSESAFLISLGVRQAKVRIVDVLLTPRLRSPGLWILDAATVVSWSLAIPYRFWILYGSGSMAATAVAPDSPGSCSQYVPHGRPTCVGADPVSQSLVGGVVQPPCPV